MFTIFKKGNRRDPDNYRGSSVINCIAKLYDMVVCDWLERWFRPFREQSGAQKSRGCLEHIVTLRLLTDTAKRKKFKLFVTFIDFSKAYDLVPRQKLFAVLKKLGCGMVMLAAITAMYRVTECVVGTAVITATIGVRQGSPTSCLLFVLFVNELIAVMKEKCQPEGFLQWLHILVMMDDTVLLSTNRDSMIKKLEIPSQFCQEYGMIMNSSKTKFFVINGDEGDTEPIRVRDLIIEQCSSYVYLGSPFTSDGSVSSAVQMHSKNKLCHVLKYVSFVNKNRDIPFIVKRRVFDAALTSSLMYGCESWVGADVKPVIKLYNWALKQMLGVRRSTSNLVCYAEVGYPTPQDFIKWTQQKFFHRMWVERSNMLDDPLSLAIRVAVNARTHTGKVVNEFINNRVLSKSALMNDVHTKITDSVTSRCLVYKEMNPNYQVHEIYRTRHSINEINRISFTRFRVCGHSLAIETGRWNRRGRGRLPIEERLCRCGLIQTERHVVEVCPVTEPFRTHNNINRMEELFDKTLTFDKTCKIIHEILNLYC